MAARTLPLIAAFSIVAGALALAGDIPLPNCTLPSGLVVGLKLVHLINERAP
jgi:hypothetical protein